MKLNMLRVCVPVVMLMIFQSGYGTPSVFAQALRLAVQGDQKAAVQKIIDSGMGHHLRVINPDAVPLEELAIPEMARLVREQYPNYRPSDPRRAELLGVGPIGEEVRSRQKAEIQSRIQDLSNLGGNPEILKSFSDGIRNWEEKPQYEAALNRANAEITRLRQEAELRRQQEEARARQEAEQRRQEEEARAKREAELLRQQEEERAKQAEEVQQRMRDLENLGGNPAILNKFANGTRSPEEIIKYRAALNRADAEIERLKREADLNRKNEEDESIDYPPED